MSALQPLLTATLVRLEQLNGNRSVRAEIGQPVRCVVQPDNKSACIFATFRMASRPHLGRTTMLTIALSHLLGRGVRLDTHEAVALARELLSHPCGIPTLENIQLGADGSVSCATTVGTPTVTSVAAILEMLLPDGTPRVPAALRYVIARGLEAVEGPRFASLNEFSAALERFEKGASREVLRGLLHRVIRPCVPAAAPTTVDPAPAPAPATPASRVIRPVAVFPSRPTLVLREERTDTSEPLSSTAGAAPVFMSFSVGQRRLARKPAWGFSRRAIAGAGALITSFAIGFAVADRMAQNSAATPTSASGRLSALVTAVRRPAHQAATNTPEVQEADKTIPAGEGTPAPPKAEPPTPSRVADAGHSVGSPSAQVSRVGAIDAATANAFSPAFSSDGTAIFFQTGGEHDHGSAIEVATSGNASNGDLEILRVVDDGSHNYHAQPSPDGRLLAFDSDRDGERGVYVANGDGSGVRRVSGPGYAAVPTWSRDNKWLAYVRAEPGKPSVWNLWVQPTAGGSARRVTNYRYGQTWAASWFPDNRHIAYSHEATLVILDLQTDQATRFPTPVKGQLVRTPAVSPDGTKVIFQVFRHGAWILSVRDRSTRQVLTDPTAEEFAWSPDGSRVAFHSRRNGRWNIYLLSTR